MLENSETYALRAAKRAVAVVLLATLTIAGSPLGGLATVAAADVDQTDRFVAAAYQDFVGRSPTPDEQAEARSTISRFGRSGFLHEVAYSDPWVGAVVDSYYRNILRRSADPGGRAYWVARILDQGTTPATVASSFFASDEYYQRVGGSNVSDWVEALYRDVLGREPDAPGHRHWIERTGQEGRLAVAMAFYRSTESRQTRVQALYLDLLDRPADPSGMEKWTTELAYTGNDVALAIDLAASREYFEKANRSG